MLAFDDESVVLEMRARRCGSGWNPKLRRRKTLLDVVAYRHSLLMRLALDDESVVFGCGLAAAARDGIPSYFSEPKI